jgi:4-diphosphocytidyl-2-C-methyl-D-erythritol kinase
LGSQVSRWLRVAAPAKLNLMLQITGRRADGYHVLQTVIDPIDWMDEIRLRRRTDARIVRRYGPRWIAPDQDLVVRAALLLQQHTAYSQGAEIILRKRVPCGAGLGGGSGAAAAVLLGLNRLWRLHLPVAELEQLSLRLGTDIPAALRRRPVWAEHLGERLTELPLPSRHYVVVYPQSPAATAAMYQSPELQRDSPPLNVQHWLDQPLWVNSFEPLLCRLQPAVQRALDWLRAYLPDARLTGSGSAIFGTAHDRTTARNIARSCPPQWLARACRSWRG